MGIFTPGNIMFVQREGDKAKHQCRLLGLRTEEFLVVELLRSSKGLPIFIMGDRCVMRLLHNGKIYGFRTVIERTINEPFPLGIFRYPSDFESKNLREGSRVPTNIQARIKLLARPKDETTEDEPDQPTEPPENEATEDKPVEPPKPDQPHVATIIDISESGIQLAIPILDAKAPEDERPDVPPGIGNEDRSDYLPEALEKTYTAGENAEMSFSLPAPVQAEFEGVQMKVCWVKINNLYLFAGLCFLDPTSELTDAVEALIKNQETYFQPRILSPMPR